MSQLLNLKSDIDASYKSTAAIVRKLQSQKISQLEDVLLDFDMRHQKDVGMAQIPSLSLLQMETVSDLWENCSKSSLQSSEIVQHPHILEKLTYKNMGTLKPGTWLNDEVINAYLRITDAKLQAISSGRRLVNTFFFDEVIVKQANKNKWKRMLTRRGISLATLDSLFIPVNVRQAHWLFLEINFHDSKITVYDSMSSGILGVPSERIVEFANSVHEEMTGRERRPFTEVKKCLTFPSQHNSFDCGVFMLKGMDLLARFGSARFSQADTEYLRYLICFELVQGRFLGTK